MTARDIRAKEGTDANSRAILTATGNVAAPTLASHGYDLDHGDFVHVLLKFDGTVLTALVTPWFYSSIAEKWYAEAPIDITKDDWALIETQGVADRIALQVSGYTGSGNLRGWAAESDQGGK